MFLIILTLISGFLFPNWSDPVVLETCGSAVFSWESHPDIDFQIDPIGKITVDGIDYNLSYQNNLWTTAIPLNSKVINGGYLILKDGSYLGVIKETTVKCNKIFLPMEIK